MGGSSGCVRVGKALKEDTRPKKNSYFHVIPLPAYSGNIFIFFVVRILDYYVWIKSTYSLPLYLSKSFHVLAIGLLSIFAIVALVIDNVRSKRKQRRQEAHLRHALVIIFHKALLSDARFECSESFFAEVHRESDIICQEIGHLYQITDATRHWAMAHEVRCN